jgi:hypothetical protein
MIYTTTLDATAYSTITAPSTPQETKKTRERQAERKTLEGIALGSFFYLQVFLSDLSFLF